MSTSGDKRSRAVCIKAFELHTQGFTNREIADVILCRVEQVPGKVNRGRLAAINDGRFSPNDSATTLNRRANDE